MAASSQNLMDEFDSSLQNCLSAFTNQEHFNISDQDEIKQSADQTVQKFLDVAKQMEAYFLQKRLMLSIHKPEQIIKEDIGELKAEIQRKDALIEKHYNNLQQWQGMISRTGQTGQAVQGPAVPTQQIPQPMIPASAMSQGHSPGHGVGAVVGSLQSMPPPSHQGNYPQGPLAYLEQTTSNIGMPERR